MKVTINKNELQVILKALEESEHRWREDAYRQHTEAAQDQCISEANAMHQAHDSLVRQREQASKPKHRTDIQRIDPFAPAWDPNDPRNW